MKSALLGRWRIDIMRSIQRLNHSRAAIKGWRTRRKNQEMAEIAAGGFKKCASCPRTITAKQELCGRCWSKKHAAAP